MVAGKFGEACPKLEASQRLDPGVGTLLNLGDCHEKVGRTASAWTEFREAASAARANGSTDREAVARERASALEPRLSYLIITVKNPATHVTRDGTPLDEAMVGTRIPVDPGDHHVEAIADGKAKWSDTVHVMGERASVTVDVPELARLAPGAETPGIKSRGSTQRTVAIVVGAAGVVGLGLGTVFGLKASSTWNSAKSHCTDYPRGCGDEGVSQGQDAKGQATIATAGFVVGGVALAGAAALWFTAPSSRGGSEMAFGVGPTGLLARGRF
jgi:hypothetical protein